MGDITVPFCEGFREYLLNAKQLKHPDKQLAQNSAAGYWSTFRGFLKIAYQEKLLQENVNDYLDRKEVRKMDRDTVRFIEQTPLDIVIEEHEQPVNYDGDEFADFTSQAINSL